ncbi:MAG: cysteine synthase A [Bacilli bacterium]|jgi:cysteine synthase A|nr:cysteine synthase A [Bacilli bacterium]MCH4235229.1 cysteine synthase A [Bacilli bacterium]
MKRESMLELIGNTPMVAYRHNDQVLWLKLEMFNPTGSVKVRPAFFMLKEAKEQGLLHHQSHIVEATSGNMGIALAFVAAQFGYKFTAVMPETMSEERRALIRAYGANIVLTAGSEGMKGAIQEAERMGKEDVNIFIPHQFDNGANANAHYKTTGPEIYRDSEGKVEAFIAGIGSGGTITGVGRYLKEKHSTIKIIGLEPENSPVLTANHGGKHRIQGIGAGFVPSILDRSILDEVLTIKDEEAIDAARLLAKEQGIFVGISSGAAFSGALRYLTAHPEIKEAVTILPDTGERYLSLGIF